MKLANKAAKILTNKYFLYFIVFLAVTNVFGYLVMHKTNAVIFFALVGVVMYQFSKNMAVVLMVCLFATNLLMSSNILREGLENASDSTTKDESIRNENIKRVIDDRKNSENTTSTDSTDSTTTTDSNGKKVVAAKKIENNNSSTMSSSSPVDVNNLDLNKILASTDVAPQNSESTVSGMSTMNNKKNNKNGRIDYASTLEEAYDNLDKILGGDGMKNLTQDTEKLMKRQQELFKTMETMTPMLDQAKSMLEGFDMNSLKGLTNFAAGFSSTK
jgi:uncharacterized membrane protein YciS (DUF1049 family)